MGVIESQSPYTGSLGLFDWIVFPAKFIKSEKYAILMCSPQILLKSKFDLLVLLVHDGRIWQVNKVSKPFYAL